ncbi:hypothetical protein KF840_09580 [bacterium]|nr:hypothetical protein [bacterium]
MSKYGPLEDYLKGRTEKEVPMTFEAIERIIGAPLPPSAGQRAWWSNNEQSSVITRAWKRAGYESANVDMSGRKLVFRRVAEPAPAAPPAVAEAAPAYVARGRHPLRGALKGLLGIAPGTDLAAPADPEWGDRAE